MGAFASLGNGATKGRPAPSRQPVNQPPPEETYEEQPAEEEAPPPPPAPRAAPPRTITTTARPVTPAPAPRPAAPRPGVGAAQRRVPAPTKPASIYEGIERVEINRGYNFPKPGRYLVRIDQYVNMTDRSHRPVDVTFMTVVHVFHDANGRGYSVGDEFVHWNAMSDYFLKKVKAFIACALACDPAAIDKSDCETIAGETQPLTGFVLDVEGKEKPEKNPKPGQPVTFYTNLEWNRRWNLDEVADLIGPENMARFFEADEEPQPG